MDQAPSPPPRDKKFVPLETASWLEDPDEPDRMTDEEIDRMIEGIAKAFPELVVKQVEKDWDESKHPRVPAGSPEGGQFGTGGGGGEASGGGEGGKYGLVPGDVEKFHALTDEWAKVNDESIKYQDKADSPEALAAVSKMEAIVKQIHGLHADPGGPGGIGLPGGPRDVLIIGGGPGGLTAGIHGAAEGLDTLVVESNVVAGGQAKFSSRIENFPGFPLGVTGEKLFQSMATQAERLGAETKLGVRATEMTVDEDGLKHVTLSNGEVIDARTVIIAGGAEFRKLPFKGADGPGVEYESPKKLASLGRGGTVCVIGGSNGAAQAALGCAAAGCKVILLTRSAIAKGMSSYVVATVRNNPSIEVVQGEIAELVRDANGNPQEVHTKDGQTFPSKGVGIFAGNVPETRWVPAEVKRGEGRNNNKLHTNEDLMTSIPGVFAVGDMRDRGAGRIIAAAGEGAIALRQALGVLGEQKEAAGIKADKPRKKVVKPAAGFETTITDLADLDRANPWFNQTIEDVPPIKKAWDEDKHPREPAGSSGGGQFTSSGGGDDELGSMALGGEDRNITASTRKVDALRDEMGVDDIPFEQRQALDMYTADSTSFNRDARAGYVASAEIENLDQLVGSYELPRDVTVYRTVGWQRTKNILDHPDGSFSDPAYMSTTLDKSKIDKPGSYIEIQVPKGSRAFPVGSLSNFPEEAEILFPRDARLQIISHEPRDAPNTERFVARLVS